MLTKLLGIKDAESVNYFEWSLRKPWPLVALLLVIVAVVYVVLLYRRERGLGTGRRIFFGTLRSLLLAALILMFFEPVFAVEYTRKIRGNLLVLLDRSDSMKYQDQREKPEDQQDAALSLGKIGFKDSQVPEALRAQVEKVSRIDLAKGILRQSDARVFDELSKSHNVRYFNFAQRLRPIDGDGPAAADALLASRDEADAGFTKTTALGSAIDDAVAAYSGQPISGIVILSDGGSNQGSDPLETARQLKDRNIPVLPIGIGLPNPPDVKIQDLIVQETVFAEDQVPIHVNIHAAGFSNQPAELQLSVDGVVMQTKPITLIDGYKIEDLTYTPAKRSGPYAADVKVSIAPLPGETITDNNTLSKSINVTDEKIKVLYIEGKPRWEYRYLRAVLLRDKRLSVKFLMTQGDADLAKEAPDTYIDRFPEEAASAFKYDLVIIGDVPSSYFRPTQMSLIEGLVKERGGSLLMLAGHRYAPATYANSPLGGMLPVKIESSSITPVDGDLTPAVTPAGMSSAAVALETTQAQTDQLWSVVHPMYMVPQIGGTKPGAHVLLTLSKPVGGTREPYPLVCWQQDGSGKVMYVGTDQLWRLRFKQGDKYHAKFWSQTIQFLTLSRLLGDNKRIKLQTDQPAYEAGQRVHFFATVLTSSYEPVRAPQYMITLQRQGDDKDAAQIKLDPIPESAGMFQGYYTVTKEGQWSIKVDAEDQANANAPKFTVTPAVPLESQDIALQEPTLRKMAELSGGQYLTVRDLQKLPTLVKPSPATAQVRLEKELWDLPIVFIVLIVLAGTEWYMRRRSNLL